MRIVEVTAVAFGGLRGPVRSLGRGLNIIWGPNESGKSTWHGAMYAALCGLPDASDPAGRDRFGYYRRPRSYETWLVDAVVELDDGRRIKVHQDLLSPASSTAVDLLAAQDVTGVAGPEGVDLTRMLGLSRRAYGATSWVEQYGRQAIHYGDFGEFREIVDVSIGADLATKIADRLERQNEIEVLEPLRRAERDEDEARATLRRAEVAAEQRQQAASRLEKARANVQARERQLQAAQAAAEEKRVTELANQAEAKRRVVFGGPESLTWAAKEEGVYGSATTTAAEDLEPHYTVVAARERYTEALRLLAEYRPEEPAVETIEIRPPRRWTWSSLATVTTLVGVAVTLIALGFALYVGGLMWITPGIAVVLTVAAVLVGRWVSRPRGIVLTTAPGDSEFQHLQDSVDRYHNELRDALVRRGFLTGSDGVDATLARYVEACASRKRMHDNVDDNKTKLRYELEQLERELEAARERLRSYQVGLSFEELARARDTFADVVQKQLDLARAELLLAEGANETAIRNAVGVPSVLEARGGLADAEQTVSALRRGALTLERTVAFLRNATDDRRTEVRHRLSERTRRGLADITGYPEHHFDIDEHFEVVVGTPGDMQQADRRSHGMAEQARLIQRAELGALLAYDGATGPLLLDDVTSPADPDRVPGILDALRRIARRRQVVVFAHDQATRSWAQHHADGVDVHLSELLEFGA